MKNILKTIIAAVVALVVTDAAAQPRDMRGPGVTVLRNLTVVDVENSRTLAGTDIIIEGGKIKEIGKALEATGAQVVDLTGKYAVPGIIDAHVHIANGAGVTRAYGQKELEYLVGWGVTSVRDVGGDARLLAEWKRAIDINDFVGPDIYYSAYMATREYYGGPRLNRAMVGGMEEEFAPWMELVEPGCDLDKVMIAAKATGATGVKLYLGYDKDYTKQLADAARKHGLEVWSHAMLFPAKPSEVAAAGGKVLSHAYMFEWENQTAEQRGINPKDAYALYQEIDRDNLDFTEFVEIALANDVILDATLVVGAKMDQYPYAFAFTRKLHEAGVKVAAGTDWFMSGMGMKYPPIYDEIDLLIEQCGFSNMEALRSATIIAAETFAGQDRKGSIASGKDADIVILDADPIADIANLRKINRVFKKGRAVEPHKTVGGDEAAL